MTLDEAIKRFNNNAEYERSHGSLQGCLEFRQLAEWLTELKKLKEQTEPCEDRKNCPHRHENGNCLSVGGFCLAVDDKHCQLKKEPCGKDINVTTTDAISRETVASEFADWFGYNYQNQIFYKRIKSMPSVQPEPFINKPCVSEQACHEDKMKVLDKIRERIELEKLGYTQSSGYYKAIIKCLQIIDKYKAESEE